MVYLKCTIIFIAMKKDNLIYIVNITDNYEQHVAINIQSIKEYYFYNSLKDPAKHKLVINYTDGTERVFSGNAANEIFTKLKFLFNPTPIQVTQSLALMNS